MDIDCSAVGFGENDTDFLHQSLASLADVESLVFDLSHNALDRSLMQRLMLELGKFTNLTTLKLCFDGSAIDDDSATGLGLAIGKLSGVTRLTLSLQYNAISAVGAGYLGAGVSKLADLTVFDLFLKFNQIPSQGASDLAVGLSKLHLLHSLTLDLAFNNIQDAGVVELATGLVALEDLASLTLDLRNNPVEEAFKMHAARDVLASFSRIPQLKVLGLDAPVTTTSTSVAQAHNFMSTAGPTSLTPQVQTSRMAAVTSTSKVGSTQNDDAGVILVNDTEAFVQGKESNAVGDVADGHSAESITPGTTASGNHSIFSGSSVLLILLVLSVAVCVKYGDLLREQSSGLLDAGRAFAASLASTSESLATEDDYSASATLRSAPMHSAPCASDDRFDDLYNQSLQSLQVADRAE